MEWTTQKRKVSDLTPYSKNPRVIKEKQLNDLKASISKFGLAEPIVIQPDGLIVGGHARYQVLLSEGVQECDCYVPDRALTEKEVEELNIRLNKNVAGVFDFDILANEFDQTDLIDWGFEPFELGLEEKKKKVSFSASTAPKEVKCPNCAQVFDINGNQSD